MKIKAGAGPFLEEGEEVRAAILARPRGWTMAEAAGYSGDDAAELVAGRLGRRKMERNVSAAAEAGFQLANPMALAVTQGRLLSIAISVGIGWWGIGVKVKELVSAVPLGLVDDIKVRRLAVGKTVTITIRGVQFTLEVPAGQNVRGVVAALEGAKSV
ncbi:MAG: hypothetical protein ICV67_03120 [Thermoleophilia bacterium]|nr:hypothetical protein [Thermoleophilia bacterium]